jgi:hypothetical protein
LSLAQTVRNSLPQSRPFASLLCCSKSLSSFMGACTVSGIRGFCPMRVRLIIRPGVKKDMRKAWHLTHWIWTFSFWNRCFTETKNLSFPHWSNLNHHFHPISHTHGLQTPSLMSWTPQLSQFHMKTWCYSDYWQLMISFLSRPNPFHSISCLFYSWMLSTLSLNS